MTFTNFPSEIISHIFGYLSLVDLVSIRKTCKSFSNSIPVFGPLKIIQENALLLWNYQNGNFNVDKEGRLVLIRYFHLRARCSKYLNEDKVIQRVNKIVEMTLQEIYKINQQGSDRFYVWNHWGWFPQPMCYYPADYLATRILNSPQFANHHIHLQALRVQTQAAEYEKIRDKYPHAKYQINWEQDRGILPDERVAWSDLGLKEALFNDCFDWESA